MIIIYLFYSTSYLNAITSLYFNKRDYQEVQDDLNKAVIVITGTKYPKMESYQEENEYPSKVLTVFSN